MCKCLGILLLFFSAEFFKLTSSSVDDNRVDDYEFSDGGAYGRAECRLPANLRAEIQGYQSIVNHIVNQIVYGKYAGDTYNSLLEMTDTFGPRLAGSENLERSIDYMVEEFHAAGLENVHTEDAVVPHWVRGSEYAMIVSPRNITLPVLGLGYSVGTPKEGIVGDVVAVESFEELSAMPYEHVAGKIVVFVPPWRGYGGTVKYRSKGASAAAKKGAIASLIRSMTPVSIGSLHTGMQSYEQGVPKIPTACITVEDAEMLLRLYRRGENVTIFLRLDYQNLPPVISRNTIGELRGYAYPPNTSVVVLSGHLDSWDVGVGAMDDGGGAYISWKSLQYLKDMGLRPKRTLRSILWTAEEFGLIGADAYQKAHKKYEKNEFNFFIESDIGTFEPLGMSFSGNKDAECIFKEVLSLMTPLNATQFQLGADGGPDIDLWLQRGFPGASLLNKNDRYFWFHHSAGDTMMVEDPHSLDKCTALFAATAFVIADLSIDIPKNVN